MVPTPPSSVSMPRSPTETASPDLPSTDLPPTLHMERNSPKPNQLPRSGTAATASSLPSPRPQGLLSPIPMSPTTVAVSRNGPSRNLAAIAATGSSSPVPRSRSGLGFSSPARANTAAKTKGFKLLQDLQARLRATNHNLAANVSNVSRRNVSAPMPLLTSKRLGSNVELATAASTKLPNTRVATMSKIQPPLLESANISSTTLLSPQGWVMVGEQQDTPVGSRMSAQVIETPGSPLEIQSLRMSSFASTASKALPSRPGIPSPLTGFNALSRSARTALPQPLKTISPDVLPARVPRSPPHPEPRYSPASKLGMSVTPRPPSRQITHLRTPSQLPRVSDTSPARPDLNRSLQAQRSIGHGRPPSTSHTPSQQILLSVSQNHGRATPSPALKRSTRRSSVGVQEQNLPPTGIPAPRACAGRPVSVPVFESTPPPVPRIPSVHLRDIRRTTRRPESVAH